MTGPAIPAAALKKHIAILGMNGSGKTSVAKSQIIEPALDRGERVCNIDPTGVGWGLRLSATGKSKGFAIYIVGGEHADFPLFRRDGKAWGEIVGTSSDSYVFDTSQMTVEDRGQWFTDFAETLIRKNKGPINLVLDEAHLFAPQAGARAGGIAPKMLHATNNLLALGRSKGLIVTMISQRPAKLHKDSLTQAHTLIAMALMAPQDRNAVKDWIADQADVERGKEIIASLPSMKPGEGWIWAPKEGVLERVRFARPKTFDSSSAPDRADGEVVLSPINPDAIKARLADVAKETVANDPKALRAEIAALKSERQKLSVGKTDINPQAIKEAEERGFERAKAEIRGAADKVANEFVLAAMTELHGCAKPLLDVLDTRMKAARRFKADIAKSVVYTPPPAVPRPAPSGTPLSPSRANPRTPIANGDGTLAGPLKRIVDAMAWWSAFGVDRPTRVQVAFAAGYKPNTGTVNTYLGRLSSGGFVSAPEPGLLELTAAGRAAATTPGTPTAPELHDRVRAVLDGPLVKITNVLLDQHPLDMTRSDLALASGYQPDTGTFNTYLGRLNSAGVTVSPSRGRVAAAAWLFP